MTDPHQMADKNGLTSVEAAFAEATSAEATSVEATNLHKLLDEFVALYAGMRQHDSSWYASMGMTVGGSEIAALMGMNPYSSFRKVVASKIATLRGQKDWDGGGIACHWGTLFEDVIAAIVAADMGGKIVGDDISIRDRPGHRNSPDGYIVARFYTGVDGELHIWTTNLPRADTHERIALLEFKCPLSRTPTGTVPRQYKPQLWSGLMVSPVASLAIFVDSVFRKCALGDLGPTAEYDTNYHRRGPTPATAPFAWGLIEIYAPRLDAPLGCRMGWAGAEWAPGDASSEERDADASVAAWRLHAAYFGTQAENNHATHNVVDFGDASAKLFESMMALVDRGAFTVRGRERHRFADGRGADLGGVVEAARRAPPPSYWLLGVLPWKLFETTYIPVERDNNFEAIAMPLIAEAHQIVADAIASGAPEAYLATVPRFAVSEPTESAPSKLFDAADVQDLFDSLS